MKLVYTCKFCGGEFTAYPSASPSYCSQACHSKGKAKGVTYTCATCGASFPGYPSNPRKYCSRTCAGLHRPVGVEHRKRPVEDRFWKRVNKDGPIPTHRPELGSCWEYDRGPSQDYGMIWVGSKKEKAHRVGYQLQHGSIRDDLDVLHHCDNPPCVRGSHLYQGTDEDNSRDKVQRRRQAQGEAHGMAKLSDVEVAQVRQLRAQGRSYVYIGSVFEVTREHVRQICLGNTRKG